MRSNAAIVRPDVRYSSSMRDRWIRIDLARQRLDFCDGVDVERSYAISTGARGAGERMGSEQTPRGAHEIKELIGGDAAIGSVFIGRRPTGEICTTELCEQNPQRDWILTRIIRLSGLEEGRNLGGEVDTFARYIYIHGTPDSEPMGRPLSHGCIRMRNQDVVELFELVRVGMSVQIEE